MFNQGPPNPMGVPPRQKVLPAWIRAELAKREEEKMKKEQKDMEKSIENMQEQKQNSNGGIPGKSKFDSDSEESDQELPQDDRQDVRYSDDEESAKEEEDFDREAVQMQCTMKFITEILLDVTSKEIKEVVKRELYKAKRGKICRKLKNINLLGSGLVAGYSSDEGSSSANEEEDQSDDDEDITEQQLERKIDDFERKQRALL